MEHRSADISVGRMDKMKAVSAFSFSIVETWKSSKGAAR